jgi:hypothetical protein
MNDVKIFYCTICQFPEEALPNSYRVKPYVDEIVVVHNQSVIAQVKSEFDDLGATLHYVDWKEDFSYKRNQYIQKTGDIIREKGESCGYTKNNTWMLVSDIDEFPSLYLLEHLKTLITKAEIQNSTICTINAHDIFIKGEGTPSPFTFIPRSLEEISKDEIISQSIGNYYKELLVKYQTKLEYQGKVHHTLHGSSLKIMQAPKDYYYDHIKTNADLHSHGCRNWFIGGGGVQEFSQKWKDMRSITDKYGFDTWEKMEKAMKIGNIHFDILQFFVDHKDDNDRHTDSELRSFYSYYKILHENELKNIVQTIKTVVTKDGIINAVPRSKKKDETLVFDSAWRRGYSDSLCKELVSLSNSSNTPKTDISSKISCEISENKVPNELNDSDKRNIELLKKVSCDPEVIEWNKTISKSDTITESDDEIREFVENTYNQILGRAGDPGGVKNYVEIIKSGRLKKEKLVDVFRKSFEYLEKGLDT